MNTKHAKAIDSLAHAERMVKLAKKELIELDNGRLGSVTFSQDDIDGYLNEAVKIINEVRHVH